MPVTCARCAAVNPDGNLYCQACGAPLTAVGAVVTARPMFGHGGYQSPYYTPYGPSVPMHRTPWTMIVAGVVALVVVLAGGGTALALIANHPNPSAATAIDTGLASPSPGVTPTPIASPTATSTAQPGTESNAGVIVPVPSGWTVQVNDSETIVLFDPNSSGSFTAASGPSSPAQTAQDNKNTIDDFFKSKYPDAHSCAGTTAHSGALNGVQGIYWEVCYTLTSGTSATPATAWVFAGANTSGSVYYLVMVNTTPDNLKNYLEEAKPVLAGLKWKLS